MTVVHLSTEARTVVERERESVQARVTELRRQSKTLHALVEDVDNQLRDAERLLRRVDEMLGLAPQLAVEAIHTELRGKQLREIAVEVLRQRRGCGAEIHYREWFALLEEEGIRIGGKSPTATLLTQITKSSYVESVRPRSGLYRLKSA